MMKVLLADGTIINNCTNSTTSNEIYALRESYGEAGAVRDLFTKENSNVITVKNDTGEVVTKGANLILLDGCEITVAEDGFVCGIKARTKTETEIMKEEIAELQEAIIEG